MIEVDFMRQWTVTTVRHSETGLLVATSDDLPGFYAHGRSEREIEERIPQAMKSLLEAQSGEKIHIVKCESRGQQSGFEPMIAHYALEDACA